MTTELPPSMTAMFTPEIPMKTVMKIQRATKQFFHYPNLGHTVAKCSSMEDILHYSSRRLVAIVLRTFIQYCWTGKCGLFGEGGLIMYDIGAAELTAYDFYDLLAVVFLEVIGDIRSHNICKYVQVG
ncbi:hypothetical protein RND81_04G022300 [Saponaria officinalis]|uniref:Uncharacterized protein n=1 Tax=Saponaria officinalis TaxID=3572 RepID=A0AAW1LED0_SAPOF